MMFLPDIVSDYFVIIGSSNRRVDFDHLSANYGCSSKIRLLNNTVSYTSEVWREFVGRPLTDLTKPAELMNVLYLQSNIISKKTHMMNWKGTTRPGMFHFHHLLFFVISYQLFLVDMRQRLNGSPALACLSRTTPISPSPGQQETNIFITSALPRYWVHSLWWCG